MTTKRDLALAYSPGVAAPVKAISENPEAAYDYTAVKEILLRLLVMVQQFLEWEI